MAVDHPSNPIKKKGSQFRKLIPLTLLLLFLSVILVTHASAWPASLEDWEYRRIHNITGDLAWSTQTNYAIKFIVYTSSGTTTGNTIYLGGNSQPDLDDLRFADTSETPTFYDYWIESTSSPYTIWVENPTVTNGTNQIAIYWGNAAATSYSNGDNAAVLFDHFENPTSALNTSKWITVSGAPVVASSLLTMSTPAGGRDIINTFNLYGNGYAYRLNAKMEHTGTGGNQLTGFYDGSTKAVLLLHQTPTAGGKNNLYVYDAAASSTSWANAGDVYCLYEVFRTSSYVNATRDGVQVGSTITTNIPSASLNITFDSQVDANGVILADWIFLRKLVNPEPAHSTWYPEESQVASFTSNITTGYAPLSVQFTDTSTGATEWSWAFGDTGTSSDQNPIHVYSSVGTYSVNFSAVIGGTTKWSNQTEYITVLPNSGSGWLSGYLYRKKISVPSTYGSDLTNYNVPVEIFSGVGASEGTTVFLDSHSLNNMRDINFTTFDGETILPFYIESGTSNTTHERAWFKADSLHLNTTTDFYLYYGKADDDTSNILTTFEFGEDCIAPWTHLGRAFNASFTLSPVSIHYDEDLGYWIGIGSDYTNYYYCYATDIEHWISTSDLVTGLPAGEGFDAIKINNTTYYAWVSHGSPSNIGLYSSNDYKTWSLVQDNVLTVGGAGTWDDAAIANHAVWYENGTYHILYEARRIVTVYKIGYANSTDGITWTKYPDNPVISTTGSRNGPDSVYKIGSTYWAFPWGSESGYLPSQQFMYYSQNPWGPWTQTPGSPFFTGDITDDGWGNSVYQVGDNTIHESNGKTYDFYANTADGTSTPGNTRILRYNGTLAEAVVDGYNTLNSTKFTLSGYITKANDGIVTTGTASVIGKTTYPTNHALVTFGGGTSQSTYFGFADTSANIREYFNRNASNYININTNDGVTVTDTTLGLYSNYPAQNYYEILRNGTTSTIFKMNLTGVHTQTANIPTGSSETFAARNVLNQSFFFIRPYVSADPSISAWGTEEVTLTPTPTPTPPTPTLTPTPTPGPLTANFYGFPTSGPANLTVHFYDTSTGGAATWLWIFDYGNPDSPISYEQNPTHIYSIDGWYTVNLTTSGGNYTDSEVKVNYIHVGNITEGIPERHGETWIRWTWAPGTTEAYDVYIDGTLAESASTLGYYYLTGLNANERHRIDLYDTGNPIAYGIATTDKESYLAYIMAILGVIFAVITVATTQEPGKVIISGSLTFIIGIYLAANTWTQLGPMSFFGMGLVIFAGIWVGRAMWVMYSGKVAWY